MKQLSTYLFRRPDAPTFLSVTFKKLLSPIGRYGWVLSLLFLLFSSLRAEAQALNQEWGISLAGKGTKEIHGVARDSMGDVYVTGVFTDTLDFDPGPGTAILSPLAPNSSDQGSDCNFFIAKYDAAGNYKWVKQITGHSSGTFNSGDRIALDGQGNIVVVGSFDDSTDFDPGPNAAIQVPSSPSGKRDIFISKYDNAGNYLWAKTIGGTETLWTHGMALDDAGNMYISGTFKGTADFDPGVGNAPLTSAGSQDNFIAKYDVDGNYSWAHRMGDTASQGPAENGLGITVDADNNVVATGAFSGNATFSSSSSILTAGGGRDVYIMKHDSAGNFIWAIAVGSAGDDYAYNVTTDNAGNIYAVGYFSGQVDFDPGSGNAILTANAFFDGFLAKYDPGGEYQWALHMGSGFLNDYHSVGADSIGNVYVCGMFSGSTDFDPGPDTVLLSSLASSTNAVVAKYDAENGAYLWAGVLESTTGSWARSLAADPFGTVYVAGGFSQAVDLDPGAGTDIHSTNTGGNIFLLKLACSATDSTYLNEVVCDSSYTFNGETFTSSGTYIQHLPNRSHCDSMIVLDLTIEPMDAPVITVDEFVLGTTQQYASYQWLKDGVPMPGETNSELTVTENADYQVLVTNAEGCEAVSAIYTVDNVGIGDPGVAAQIQVYPNPARDQLRILSPVPVQAALYTIEGRLLLRRENVDWLSLHGLSEGVYLLQLTDREGRLLKHEKLIIHP